VGFGLEPWDFAFVTVVIPLSVWKGDAERSGGRFRLRLEQIINMRHELVRLAGEINWQSIDPGLADLITGAGRPEVSARFMVGLWLLKHIHGLSDEGVCALGEQSKFPALHRRSVLHPRALRAQSLA
jgi:hypothetical protein